MTLPKGFQKPSEEAATANPLNNRPYLTMQDVAVGLTKKPDLYTAAIAVQGISRLLLVNSEARDVAEECAGPRVEALDKVGENALLCALLICSGYLEEGVCNLYGAGDGAIMPVKKGQA